MSRIALIEDHKRLAELARMALRKTGIEADIFLTLESAWFAVNKSNYAVIVLDRGMPEGDGITLLRRLRAAGNNVPCLMLTAQNALHDRITGLESGADDYLTKPFEMEELIARVRALMRRPELIQNLIPSFCDVSVYPDEACMRKGTETVSLAPSELQIMLALVNAEGHTMRNTALTHAAWGLEEAVTPNALDVALHRLRKKLSVIDSKLRIINIKGQGYALQEV